jgi:hypothetical protein
MIQYRWDWQRQKGGKVKAMHFRLNVNPGRLLMLFMVMAVWGMIALYNAAEGEKNGPLSLLAVGIFGGLWCHHVLQELEGRHKCELDRCDFPADYLLSFRGPVPVFLGGQRSTFRVCTECAELWESRREALAPQTCLDIIEMTAQERRLQP